MMTKQPTKRGRLAVGLSGEVFWLFLLAIPISFPGTIIPLEWHPLLLLALFAFHPLRLIAQRRHPNAQYITRTPLDLSLALILLWLPVNFLVSIDPSTSWIAAGYLLLGLSLYLACMNSHFIKRSPQRLAYFLLLLGTLLVFAAPSHVEWHSATLNRFFHAIPFDLGERIHANVYAGALVLLFPFFAVFSPPVRERIEHGGVENDPTPTRTALKRRCWACLYASTVSLGQCALALFCTVMALLILLLIILTKSRGGYLATIAALLSLFFLRWPRLLYLVPLVGLAIAATIYAQGLTSSLDQLPSYESFLETARVRREIWSNATHALIDFPLTGIGIGTYSSVIHPLYPHLTVHASDVPHAHHLLLQIGLDLGVPGLIAYLAMQLNLFVMLFKTLRAKAFRDDDRRYRLALAATAALVAMLVHGLLDAVTWGLKPAFIPWLIFALITRLFLDSSRQVQIQAPHCEDDNKNGA